MEEIEPGKRGIGHRNRLRQRFFEGGIDRFSDEEIVEFLLTLGTPRKDVRLQARQALKKFGGLSGALSAPISELVEIKGIGPKNALYLSLVHQIAGRFLKDKAKKNIFFNSSKAVFDFLFHSMRDLKREVFKVLLLSRKNELIKDQDVFLGSLTGSAIYPREIITLALEHKAASMVFVHNHPSGDPSPSNEDRDLTRSLVWCSKLMTIQVLDHIIIGNNSYYSFADEGLINLFVKEYEQRLLSSTAPFPFMIPEKLPERLFPLWTFQSASWRKRPCGGQSQSWSRR